MESVPCCVRMFWKKYLKCFVFVISILCNLDAVGHTVKILSNIPLKEQITKNNYTYVIDDLYEANGEVVILPSYSILKFTGRGVLKNATIIAKSNTKILNGKFEYDIMCNTFQTQYGRDFHAPIIIECDSNILIKECEFKIGADKYLDNILAIAVFGYERPSRRIDIIKCTFEAYGVGFFSNTCKSSISNSLFLDMFHTMSIETLYDKKPYWFPNNIKVYCNDINVIKDVGLEVASIWFSGVSNLSFEKNKVKSLYNPIMLYCGDGNIALDNILIRNNDFIMNAVNVDKVSTTIQIVGKSFVYMDEYKQFGENVIVENNVFRCLLDYNKRGKARAIAAMFVSDISVINNKIIGYDEGVVTFDSFRGYKQPVTDIKIYRNIFSEISDVALIVGSGIKSCSRMGNVFNNVVLNSIELDE